jgi:predicted DNA-binding transcriptional regulator AlpA
MTDETKFPDPPPAWWSMRQVAAHLGVSDDQARRIATRSDFPAARSFGDRSKRWRITEVMEWADRQIVRPTLYVRGGGLTPGVKRGPKGVRRGTAA